MYPTAFHCALLKKTVVPEAHPTISAEYCVFAENESADCCGDDDVLTITLFLLLFALLFFKLSIPLSAVTPLAMAALGLGGFAGGLAAGLSSRQNGLAVGAVCGVLLTLILLVVSLARGAEVSPGLTALKGAVLTVCSAAGGVLGVNRYHR